MGEGGSLQSRILGGRGWGIRAEKVPEGNACFFSHFFLGMNIVRLRYGK